MNTRDTDDNPSELDRAVAGRLAKLRTMPVDTSRLDAAIRAQIPQPGRDRRMRIGWFRPFRAIAASITLLAILSAVLLSTSGGPACSLPITTVGPSARIGSAAKRRSNPIFGSASSSSG